MVAFIALLASFADVVRELGRQVPVVLRVEEVQELRGLGADHHLGLVRHAWADRVDHLVLGAVGHRLGPEQRWLTCLSGYLQDLRGRDVRGGVVGGVGGVACVHEASGTWDLVATLLVLLVFVGNVDFAVR